MVGLSDWFGLSVGLFVGLLVCLVSVVCWSRLSYSSVLELGLSDWSRLSIAMSVAMLIWVTIVVTQGDLAADNSTKIFAGCCFGSRSLEAIGNLAADSSVMTACTNQTSMINDWL